MAWYTSKEWKDRLVEFAGRRSLKNVSTNETTVYDVTRNEGVVSQEGDSFSASSMNDFEQRVKAGIDAAETAAGGCTITTEGSGADTKYYIQLGADAASKKELGNPQITNISSQFSAPSYVSSPAQAHRVTALSDLSDYQYIIVSLGYNNNGMTLDGGSYVSGCTQVSYVTSGVLGVAILQNVASGATIDFQHTGTGSANRIAYGIKI